MTPKLTDEQRKALQKQKGKPVRIEDEETQAVYFLIAQADVSTVWDDDVLEKVYVGCQQADRGECVPWDPDAIKASGRKKLEDLKTS